MDKLPDNIDSTNPHSSLIPYDSYYSTEISVLVSRVYVRLKKGFKVGIEEPSIFSIC